MPITDGSTTVVNIHHLDIGWKEDDSFVYVGRAGHGLDGYFGNRFRAEDGDAITKFGAWARERIEIDDDYRDRVKSLYGRTLVCFCKPKPCHGDVLARIAEELHNERT